MLFAVLQHNTTKIKLVNSYTCCRCSLVIVIWQFTFMNLTAVAAQNANNAENNSMQLRYAYQ